MSDNETQRPKEQEQTTVSNDSASDSEIKSNPHPTGKDKAPIE